ncbi:serine/threonine-protein kinase [Urbifossiella limnaea]|uniref:Serine/threonine-protein kinase PknB n=1 Tax=Urbifossiella limnaea TaxID=2528023 RepID=A0A517XNP9_9BACT|nr:serine/threonine-protein kinase [Urbifossiella limnaea]QDU19134.1 Serine/threonine-protein kinase PknB [Urbifossiella limnaea]
MPAAPASTTDLLDLLRKSGVAASVPAPGDLPAEPQKAAAALVKQGVITKFQAQQLLLGRHKGFRLGAYVVLEQLGRGGMGVVYLAEHLELRRKVAVKVLVVGKDDDAKLAAERFYREARAAAALDHPNIVRIFDVCRHGDTPYLVMEYVEGESLQQVLDREGALPYASASDAVAQAAAGLQHAHEKGFVHRDIKPGNLMRDKTGVVKILDMGLARSASNSDDKLTERLDAGAVVGTADFIAPEQALNSPNVDIRADIYSLGAAFYALVTGKPPFAGNTTQKLLQHQMAAPPSMSAIDATLPKGLAGVAAKMLAKKPADRFQTPGEVIAALAPWLGNSSRVLAGLSRTNLGAGVDLHARLRRSEDALSDSGVVDPSDPAAETGAVASAKTARSSPRRVEVGGSRRKMFPIVAGAVAVAASLAGIAFALGVFDREPAREVTKAPPPVPVVPPSPSPPADPPPTPKIEAPAKVTPPLPEKLLAAFDMSAVKPFTIRSVVEVKANGSKDSRELGRTGPGTPPAGWSGRAWNKDSEMEFFADATPAIGIRTLRGPGSAMLFSPKVNTPSGLCRLRVDYSAPVKSGAAHVRFKPADERGAWDATKLASTPAGVWKSAEFVLDLKGATAGLFEFHNNDTDPNGTLRVRSVVVTEPPPGTTPTPLRLSAPAPQPAPQPAFVGWTEGAVLYRFDAASIPAYRASLEGRAVTAGEAPPFPRGISGSCWKKEATGEFRRDEIDGSAALGVTNLSDLKSGQFSFELERDMGLTFQPGKAYRVKVSYQLKNDAAGSVVVQTTEYKTVGVTHLAAGGGWRTAAVAVERGDLPLRLTIDNTAVGEGNTLYFRTVEVVELAAPR